MIYAGDCAYMGHMLKCEAVLTVASLGGGGPPRVTPARGDDIRPKSKSIVSMTCTRRMRVKKKQNKTSRIGHCKGGLTWTSLDHYKRKHFSADKKYIFDLTRPACRPDRGHLWLMVGEGADQR